MRVRPRMITTLAGAIVLITQAPMTWGAVAQESPAAAPVVSSPEAAPASTQPAHVLGAAHARKAPKMPPRHAAVETKKPIVAAAPAAPADAAAPAAAPVPPPTASPGPASAGVAAPLAAQPPVIPPQTAPQPPVAQAPVPQAPGGVILGEAQSVVHARNAGITTCMDTIVAEAATVVDGAHTALSGWSSKAPNSHVFESTIGLSYNSQTAPNGAAIIIAAPLDGNRCEGATVQVYPFALSCSQIQANLIKSGHTVATLKNIPVVQTDGGPRDLLLPSAGGGCVMVSLGQRSAPDP